MSWLGVKEIENGGKDIDSEDKSVGRRMSYSLHLDLNLPP